MPQQFNNSTIQQFNNSTIQKSRPVNKVGYPPLPHCFLALLPLGTCSRKLNFYLGALRILVQEDPFVNQSVVLVNNVDGRTNKKKLFIEVS